MERRFEIRKRELLAECEVDRAVFEGAAERLVEFAKPFLAWLGRREQKDYAQIYLTGLVSDVETKNVESIAYLHDNERHRLQSFVGVSKWAHQPLLDELAIQVAREIGEADAVIVFDPSGFPKSGQHSVGVQRQSCGRLGKIDNCQVAVYLGYVSRHEQAAKLDAVPRLYTDSFPVSRLLNFKLLAGRRHPANDPDLLNTNTGIVSQHHRQRLTAAAIHDRLNLAGQLGAGPQDPLVDTQFLCYPGGDLSGHVVL